VKPIRYRVILAFCLPGGAALLSGVEAWSLLTGTLPCEPGTSDPVKIALHAFFILWVVGKLVWAGAIGRNLFKQSRTLMSTAGIWYDRRFMAWSDIDSWTILPRAIVLHAGSRRIHLNDFLFGNGKCLVKYIGSLPAESFESGGAGSSESLLDERDQQPP
jgi:hypothetical protein